MRLRRSRIFLNSLFAGILLFAAGCGARQQNGTDENPGGSDAAMEELRVNDFADHFTYQLAEVAYVAPEYDLPLDETEIMNHGMVMSGLGLGEEPASLLLKNGFAVTPFMLSASGDDVVDAYEAIERMQIPVFVTSGSLLHVYHVLFDDLLSSIEADYLYDDIWNLSRGLFEASWRTYMEAEGERREAARRNAAFLAVGLSLLRPEPGQIPPEPGPDDFRGVGFEEPVNEFEPGDSARYAFEVPEEAPADAPAGSDGIADLVRAELGLIDKHEGFRASAIFIYEDDYSQYVPRGHYTRSEKLKNYFKAMIWYGRMSMLLKGSADVAPGRSCRTCDALISEYDARIQTLGALMIASEMDRNSRLMNPWGRVYKVTAFFVGFSDDLGPYEYIDAIGSVFGATGLPADFGPGHYTDTRTRLAEYRSPLIYGGTGDCMIMPPFTPEQADECLDKTRGFRLMGQRFVPDSYIMSKLVAPHVGALTGAGMPFTAENTMGGPARVFARGMDVMAVLGSQRARDILDELGDTQYEDYDTAFIKIKDEIDQIEEPGWNQNLYWNWMWCLKGLLSEYGSGRPTFMQTEAWKDRLLTTALASWAELRHDTILYAKQSYTIALGMAPAPPDNRGFVEPVPEFYNRLLSLTRMTRLGLEEMDLLGAGQERRLLGLEDILSRLIKISIAELAGAEPEPMESEWLAGFGDALDHLLGDLSGESRKTTIVADVHTDTNSSQVLEEASGQVDLMIVAWPVPGGVYLAAGPELSYYEFKHPMDDRLTDEAWRQMLKTAPPERPPWVYSYLR